MRNSTKKILMISGVILSVGLLYVAFRKFKKNTIELKSNLVDDMLDKMGKPTVQFTFKNNTSSIKNISLFDIYNNKSSSLELLINPSMNFFNNTLPNSPKKVKRISISANGENAQIQATQPFVKVCKDASGDSSTSSYIPMVSSGQFQGGMTLIEPNDLILDGICVLDYKIQPNITVSLVIDYEEVKNSRII